MSPGQLDGGGADSGVAPVARSWLDRVNDPHEPLFTVGVCADLLGIDPQTLRRLDDAIAHNGPRPSGNQRRYSRNDLEILAHARQIAQQGHPPSSLATILLLERQLRQQAQQPAADATHAQS